jgi:flagellin
VTGAEASRTALSAIDAAMARVNTQRANLGATSNRLSYTVNNLTNVSSNLTSALGRIQDADFAAEAMALAKHQILQQSALAMLADAIASQRNILVLLNIK